MFKTNAVFLLAVGFGTIAPDHVIPDPILIDFDRIRGLVLLVTGGFEVDSSEGLFSLGMGFDIEARSARALIVARDSRAEALAIELQTLGL